MIDLPLFLSTRPHWMLRLEVLVRTLGLTIEHGPGGVAVYGPDGPPSSYRYLLTRDLGGSQPPLPFVLINPSTADHRRQDPTLTRCMDFARAMCASTVIIVNPFAFRATDVRDLRTAPDPVGPLNDEVLRWVAEQSRTGRFQRTIAGWGPPTKIPAMLRPRLGLVTRTFGELDTLARTKDGHPSHPLMLRADCRPVLWWRS